MKNRIYFTCMVLLVIFSSACTKVQREIEVKKTQLKALFMAQAGYPEKDINDMTAYFIKINTDTIVDTQFVAYEGLRDKFLLSANSSAAYDVVSVDDTWYSEYVDKGLIVDITESVPVEYTEGIFDGAWKATTVNGRKYGIPLIVDAMLLYYNKAQLQEAGLSEPPKTLDGLRIMAKTIKDKGIVEYPIIFSLAQAEALIAVYITILEGEGGVFQNANGEYNLDVNGGVEALNFLLSLKNEGLLNPNSLEYLEEDVRRIYSSGNATFTLNWTYMYGLSNDPAESRIAGQSEVAVFPSKNAQSGAAINGSMGLSISQNSDNSSASLQYILGLTSKDLQQKYSALQLPVWKASYTDPEIRTNRASFIDVAAEAFSLMGVRPRDPQYSEISSILQKYIQQSLQGVIGSQQALKNAIKEIKNL